MAARHWIGAAAGVAAGLATARWCRRWQRFEIAEESMHPALAAGDYIIAERRATPPRRGDIVIFPHPTRPGFMLVKRVIGLAGERVRSEGGHLRVDGTSSVDAWASGPSLPDGTWDVGPDTVFVLGDDRAASTDDSRSIGPVATSSLLGRARFRYWPLRRFGPLG